MTFGARRRREFVEFLFDVGIGHVLGRVVDDLGHRAERSTKADVAILQEADQILVRPTGETGEAVAAQVEVHDPREGAGEVALAKAAALAPRGGGQGQAHRLVRHAEAERRRDRLRRWLFGYDGQHRIGVGAGKREHRHAVERTARGHDANCRDKAEAGLQTNDVIEAWASDGTWLTARTPYGGALTVTFIVDTLTSTFGGRVAIQHSGLSPGERHDQWLRIRRGEVEDTFCDELMRVAGPAKAMVRKVAEAHDRNGHAFEVGDTVFLVMLVANRDPATFTDPARLDLGREARLLARDDVLGLRLEQRRDFFRPCLQVRILRGLRAFFRLGGGNELVNEVLADPEYRKQMGELGVVLVVPLALVIRFARACACHPQSFLSELNTIPVSNLG